jgi:hypothetical protein
MQKVPNSSDLPRIFQPAFPFSYLITNERKNRRHRGSLRPLSSSLYRTSLLPGAPSDTWLPLPSPRRVEGRHDMLYEAGLFFLMVYSQGRNNILINTLITKKFKGTRQQWTVINKSRLYSEVILRILNLGYACYHSVPKPLSS